MASRFALDRAPLPLSLMLFLPAQVVALSCLQHTHHPQNILCFHSAKGVATLSGMPTGFPTSNRHTQPLTGLEADTTRNSTERESVGYTPALRVPPARHPPEPPAKNHMSLICFLLTVIALGIYHSSAPFRGRPRGRTPRWALCPPTGASTYAMSFELHAFL